MAKQRAQGLACARAGLGGVDRVGQDVDTPVAHGLERLHCGGGLELGDHRVVVRVAVRDQENHLRVLGDQLLEVDLRERFVPRMGLAVCGDVVRADGVQQRAHEVVAAVAEVLPPAHAKQAHRLGIVLGHVVAQPVECAVQIPEHRLGCGGVAGELREQLCRLAQLLDRRDVQHDDRAADGLLHIVRDPFIHLVQDDQVRVGGDELFDIEAVGRAPAELGDLGDRCRLGRIQVRVGEAGNRRLVHRHQDLNRERGQCSDAFRRSRKRDRFITAISQHDRLVRLSRRLGRAVTLTTTSDAKHKTHGDECGPCDRALDEKVIHGVVGGGLIEKGADQGPPLLRVCLSWPSPYGLATWSG